MKSNNLSRKAIKALIFVSIIALNAVNIDLAVDGKISIWFFSVVISLVVLIVEGVLVLASCTSSTKINVRLLLSSVFLVIIIGELFLRSSGRADCYNEKIGRAFYLSPYHAPTDGPNSKWHLRIGRDTTEVKIYPEFVSSFVINSEGLRDEDHRVVKAADEYRIVGLGDSFTEGCGAINNQETWVKVLENSFQAHNFGRTTVFNGGLGGSDPFFAYQLLKDRLLKYSPDLVVVAINSSDIIDAITRGGMERFQQDGSVKFKSRPWFEPLFGMSHLFRLLMLNVFHYDWYLIKRDEQPMLEQKALDLLYSVILMYEKMSQEEAFDLLIVFHPFLHEVVNEEFPFQELIRKLEKEKNVEVLNLLEFYLRDEKIREGKATSYYWPLDLHHNKSGYELFSRGVKEKLETMNLMQRRSTHK